VTRQPGTLCWKYEDGPPEVAEDGHPDDVGPAWIERPGEPVEEINDGEWITRTAAVRLAEEGGHELHLDD
jgi:hypothetical protein